MEGVVTVSSFPPFSFSSPFPLLTSFFFSLLLSSSDGELKLKKANRFFFSLPF